MTAESGARPSPSGVARRPGAGADWLLIGRRALVEWALVQAIVLGSVVAVIWPLAAWARRALGALEQALAAAGAS